MDSLFHWRFSTSDLPPASHWQSLTITGTLTGVAEAVIGVSHSVGFASGAAYACPRPCGLEREGEGAVCLCMCVCMCVCVRARARALCPQGARVADAVPLTNLQYTPTRANSKIRIPCTNCVMSAVDGGKPSAGAKTSVKLKPRTAANSVLSEQLRESR